jgi:hypothetical protein
LTKTQVQVVVASIAAAAAFLGPTAAAVVQLADGPDEDSPECSTELVAKMVDLASKHPDVAKLYADPALATSLPRLANERERNECGGDAAVLLSRLVKPTT